MCHLFQGSSAPWNRLPDVTMCVLPFGVSPLPDLPLITSPGLRPFITQGVRQDAVLSVCQVGVATGAGEGAKMGGAAHVFPGRPCMAWGNRRVRCVRENEGNLVMWCKIDESVCLQRQEPFEKRCVEGLCSYCAENGQETLAARESNCFQMEIESHAGLRVAEEQLSDVMRHAGKKRHRKPGHIHGV